MYDANHDEDTPTSRLPEWLKWQPVVIGGLLAGLLGGLFTWLAILPRTEERAAAEKALAEIREENRKNKEVVENFDRFMAEFEQTEAKYEEITGRVPLEAEKERVSGDLERNASAVHDSKRGIRVNVTSFEAGKTNPLQKDRPGLASLSEVPVKVSFRGNYKGLKQLLSQLTSTDRLIAVRGYQMNARTDRAVDDSDTISATVDFATFFKRMPTAAQPAAPAAPPAAEAK